MGPEPAWAVSEFLHSAPLGTDVAYAGNVAEMELALIVSTVVLNYDLDLRQNTLETREGFLRKPLGCAMGLRRRAEQ